MPNYIKVAGISRPYRTDTPIPEDKNIRVLYVPKGHDYSITTDAKSGLQTLWYAEQPYPLAV